MEEAIITKVKLSDDLDDPVLASIKKSVMGVIELDSSDEEEGFDDD